MSTVHIRDARPGDCAAIEAVTLSAYEEYAASMTPAFWAAYRQNILPCSQPYRRRAARRRGGRPHHRRRAALSRRRRDRDRPRRHAPVRAEVRLLAVAPTTRHQGVGVALMQECERRARQTGATALTLHTTDDLMRAAMRLHERLGYGRALELDFEPALGVTVKGYRLDLAPAR